MNCVEVHDQAEFEAAAERGDCIHVSGSATVRVSGSVTVEAYDSATVVAYDSATVVAYGSATVVAYGSATVVAYGSVTVEASGSATVRASGSATVRVSGSATVEASGSATVRAYDSATVRASKYVAVQDHGPDTTINGGVIISIRRAETPTDWCDFYGVDVVDGLATLYKAVDDAWRGGYGADISYEPGATPEAPDWKPDDMCGHGLHFSPRPFMARAYHENATRYVACPVRVDDMVLLGDKVKAPRVAAPCWEVNEDGEPVTASRRLKEVES
jgi:hypothetical protein